MSEITMSKQYKNNYEDYYQDGDSEWRRICALGKADNIARLCEGLPHDRILEIGAGEGAVLKRLSELGFGRELYALEISPSGVAAIRNKGIPRLVEAARFDGYATAFGDEEFDVVILSHVIEHVEHPRLLLAEASRIARAVFVEVPLEETMRLSDDFTFDKVGHINFYTQKNIRMLLQSCNLKILHQLIVNPSKEVFSYHKGFKGVIQYYIKQMFLALAPRLSTHLFTYNAAFMCRKGVNR